jgi:hypothetical protein
MQVKRSSRVLNAAMRITLSPIQLSKVAAQSTVYLAWFLPVLVELILPKDIVL